MVNDMDSVELICECAISKCISIYEELKKSFGDLQESNYGSFPQYIFIEYYKTINGRTKLSNKRERIKMWEYENKKLKVLEKKQEDLQSVVEGMFYKEGKFSFEIESEKVRMQYVLGPRNGRCIEYEIKEESGKVLLCNEKTIWVC